MEASSGVAIAVPILRIGSHFEAGWLVRRWHPLSSSKDGVEAPEPLWKLETPVDLGLTSPSVRVPAHREMTITLHARVDSQLELWSPEQPNLYGLIVDVKRGDHVVDAKYQRFGWLIRIPRMGTDDLAHQLPLAENPVEIPVPCSAPLVTREYGTQFGWKYWILPILGIIALTAGIALSIMNPPVRAITVGKRVKGSSSAPWATLFDGSRRVLIVASDPNIEEIQRISRSSLSLSDCANQSYLPQARVTSHLPRSAL